MPENTSPTNTTAAAQADPLSTLLEVGFGAGIEGQEAQGQRELVNSSVLPKINPVSGNTQADFEALGFTFGDPVEGDDLFVHATLPEGWKREGSEHAMWSYIVDERGLRRVAVFYKAAFYDRAAHMSITNVGYEIASSYVYGDSNDPPVIPDSLTDEERQAIRDYANDFLDREAKARAGGYHYSEGREDYEPRAQRLTTI